MKICFVLEHYHPYIGGVETVFKNLAERLVLKGHSCVVITSQLGGTKKTEKIKGVNIIRVKTPFFGIRYWFVFLSIIPIIKVMRSCDIIHTTTYYAAFPSWVVTRFLAKPNLITVHEIIGKKWFSMPEISFFYKITCFILELIVIGLMNFDKTVAVSDFTRKEVIRYFPKKKVIRIHNGIDTEIFTSREKNITILKKLGIKNEFLYLYYGRPGISKGVLNLIEAVPKISKKIQDSRLILILSKNPRNNYKKIIQTISNLGIKEKVILLDPVIQEKLPDYISIVDCICVPSFSEGFGLSAAEASQMGKPIVVSKVGSLPEIIHGYFQFCYPNDPNSISEAIAKIYNKKYLYRAPKDFSWNKTVNYYLKTYKTLLNSKN